MIQSAVSQDSRTSAERSLARLVERLTERLQAGEHLDPATIAREHPDHAAQLEQLWPALHALANLSGSLARQPLSSGVGIQGADQETGTLGDYRILREVGRGGMGVVYEATQISLGRRVALKVLPFAAAMDSRQLQRFHNEARAAACLQHPHIVSVYAEGCERAVHFYAMQFIDGQPLDALIDSLRQEQKPAPDVAPKAKAVWQALSAAKGVKTASDDEEDHALRCAQGVPHVAQDVPHARETVRVPRGKLSTLPSPQNSHSYFRKVAELMIQAAEALEHAHQVGVLHRDIKPANLLVDAAGNLWITDFGLAQFQNDARMTLTGDLVGTLRYMSPEQALAKRVIVDHRTDIYSLGATFYELLTLQPAFGGQDRQELLRQIAFEEPVPARRVDRSIPVELETIVAKSIEKNPADRYASAKEMADDLKRFLKDEPTLARRPSIWQRARKWGRRHVAAVRATAAALLVVLLAVAAMAGSWLNDHARRQAETERAVTAAMQEADQLQKQRKVPEALAKMTQAKAILASGAGTAALEERVNKRLDELEMVLKLDEIKIQSLDDVEMLVDSESAFGTNNANTAQKYSQAFLSLGIDVAAGSPNDVAGQIRGRGAVVELAAGLDHWALVLRRLKQEDQAQWKRLLAIARVADPDPLRSQLRIAREQDDDKAVMDLAARMQATELPAATVIAFGDVLRDIGAFAEAKRVLLKGHERYATDFWINYQLGHLLAHRVKPKQSVLAIRFLGAAAAIRPEVAVVHNSLGVVYHDNLRQFDAAIAAYKEAVRLSPDFPAYHSNLGSALTSKGLLADAIAAYRNALRLMPNYFVAHIYLGKLLARSGHPKEALASIEAAVGCMPKSGPKAAWAHWGIGQCLGLINGQRDRAIAEYEEAIRIKPDYAEVHSDLGVALHKKGLWEESMAAYREAIRLKPDYAIAHSNLGNGYFAKGLLDEAIAACHEAILNKPDLGNAYMVLGNALKKKGLVDEAIFVYRMAISIQPDHLPTSGHAHNNLAWFLATCADPKLRDMATALTSAKKAVELDPKIANYWGTLGTVYYRNGEWQKAIDALDKALELRKTGNSYNFFALAMAHWQLDHKDQARTWYDKAVQWMEQHEPNDADLLRFRAEVAELLGIRVLDPLSKDAPAAKK